MARKAEWNFALMAIIAGCFAFWIAVVMAVMIWL